MIEDRKSHFEFMSKMRKVTSRIDVSSTSKFSRPSDFIANSPIKSLSYNNVSVKNNSESVDNKRGKI